MREATPQFRFRLIAALFLVLLWAACLDQASGPAAPDVLDGPTAAVTQLEIARALPSALRLQSQFTNELLAIPGVVGSAVALGDDGLPTVVALVEHGGGARAPGHARDRHRQVQRTRLAGGATGEAAGKARMQEEL